MSLSDCAHEFVPEFESELVAVRMRSPRASLNFRRGTGVCTWDLIRCFFHRDVIANEFVPKLYPISQRT